jgi:HSP20 family protein
MSTIMRYDPFREMLSLRKAMDQLFEQSFVRPTWGTGGTQGMSVPMNVYQDEQGYHVQVLLPGVNPDNVELSVQQNSLTLQGQFQPETTSNQQVNWLLQEIGHGSFKRSITFPQQIDADKITTSYEHGVLTIFVPISEVSRPKKISIAGAQPKQVTVEAGTH